MILLVHNNKEVIEVVNLDDKSVYSPNNINIIAVFFEIAKTFPNTILIWCHKNQKENINIEGLKKSFYLKNMMLSYSKKDYLLPQIGYVEEASPFIKINKYVKYPTWQMSGQIGAIHTSQLIKFKKYASIKADFDYVLSSIGKVGMKKGLFCYSEPILLKNNELYCGTLKASKNTLFRFVKQHYKFRWIILLLINLIWYDKKIPLLAAIKCCFYPKINIDNKIQINDINLSNKDESVSIDVIIPTIGRKSYLYNTLKDLSKQTKLPDNIIVVEQNPEENSITELDFIKEKEWPFNIIHKFIHTTGACYARNLALKEIKSDYVFLADDDIRLDSTVLDETIRFMNNTLCKATTLHCVKPNEVKKLEKPPIQWTSFGSGCSFVKSEVLKNLKFNMKFEHGFGEDQDFGMQIRNKGIDVIYNSNINLIHLKAPIGGFRTTFKFPWENQKIQPKPSPTVMLNKLLNNTNYQLLGYKTILFFKFYKYQNIKNPFTYFKTFKKRWKQSVYWAKTLKN